MKDKLQVSDGRHKIICIVKDKINTCAEGQYKVNDIIRLNKFAVKEVASVKVIIPSQDFDIICNDIDEVIGSPKDFGKAHDDDHMEQEFEIPYRQVKVEEEKENIHEEVSEESDVEMKVSPEKAYEEIPHFEEEHEIPPQEEPEEHEIPEEPEQNDEEDVYTPIKALSPMNSDWIIKARVSKKFPVKQWSNQRGEGKLLNFELVDKYGTQIQATVFNKAVDKFDPILEQDKVYVF